MVSTQHSMGILLILLGLIPIGLQLALQIGLIKPKPPTQNNLESMTGASESIKFLQTLLDKAGWMVVVGLILIYFGLRCLGVTLFGAPSVG